MTSLVSGLAAYVTPEIQGAGTVWSSLDPDDLTFLILFINQSLQYKPALRLHLCACCVVRSRSYLCISMGA